MDGTKTNAHGWKAKLAHELKSYLFTFGYLAVFFSVFAWHRRLILDAQHVSTSDYWYPLLEAAILGKVVLILDLFRLGRRLEDKPLIVPTLCKTLLFSVGIAIFGLLEHTIKGLFHHEGVMGGIDELERGGYELVARCIVKCFALIPFFAFREVGRVLGEGSLIDLFLKRSGRPVARP